MKTTGLLSFTATNDWLDDLTALCPDHQFALDAHTMPFEPLRAVQVRNALAPHGPAFVEEPIRPQDVGALGPLKAPLRAPLVTGECLHGKYPEIDRYVHRHRKLPMRPDGSTAYA